MSFHINAWLEQGEPQLEIVDAHSNAVCVSWSYKANEETRGKDRYEIQRLFRELLLLTCKQEAANCRVFKARPLLPDT